MGMLETYRHMESLSKRGERLEKMASIGVVPFPEGVRMAVSIRISSGG